MLQTPLFQVIQSLGKRERTELQRWVESPFVNRRPEVNRLCQYLCQTVPSRQDADLVNLTRYEVYTQVFQSRASQSGNKRRPSQRVEKLVAKEDAALRYAMSFLFAALKQWLAYREWSKDEAVTGLMLCKALRKRELPGIFEKEFKAIQQASSQVRATADFSLVQYQLEFERFEFNITKGQPDPVQLKKVSESFGVFVANTVLRHGCAALNTPQYAFETVDFLTETLAKVEAGHYHDMPSIQIYYRSFRLMQAREETDYFELKSLLNDYKGFFPADEIRDPWLIALNYCIFRVNSGEMVWNRETLELYQSGLQEEFILDSGIMPRHMYQNIMTVAIGCKEWDWARQFLEDYRTKLPIAERHNVYKFNLALWHFRQGNYTEAQEILLKVEFRDVYYNLNARRMMVRMYYSQGARMALDSLLHSYHTYLLRHRNIGYHFYMYDNFVRIVRQILRLKPGDTQERERLRELIHSEKHLVEREWLTSLL